MINKMINSQARRMQMKQSFSDTSNMRERSAMHSSIELLNYKTHLTRSTASSVEAMEPLQKGIKVAQQRFLQKHNGEEVL